MRVSWRVAFCRPLSDLLVYFSDESYKLFYQAVDYPVAKYLRQPLYFEVALTQSMDQQMELVLENCWATQHKDRSSLPRWNLIVDRQFLNKKFRIASHSYLGFFSDRDRLFFSAVWTSTISTWQFSILWSLTRGLTSLLMWSAFLSACSPSLQMRWLWKKR